MYIRHICYPDEDEHYHDENKNNINNEKNTDMNSPSPSQPNKKEDPDNKGDGETDTQNGEAEEIPDHHAAQTCAGNVEEDGELEDEGKAAEQKSGCFAINAKFFCIFTEPLTFTTPEEWLRLGQ